MAENITGQVTYNDLQHFAYLTEGGETSLLAVDVHPFNSLDPQDARFAYNYLKKKKIPHHGAISFNGVRRQINTHSIIVITSPF